MTPFQAAALFLALVATVSWSNARLLHLPSGTVMLIAGLLAALVLAGLAHFAPASALAPALIGEINRLDFADTVVGQMLAFLLFSGAMQVDLRQLRKTRAAVWSLAGVVASTAVVGMGVWLAARQLGLPLSLPWALVFGALISPTDPVAVISTVRHGALSPRIVAILQGEALLNDAVGIMVFLVALAFAGHGQAEPSAAMGAVLVGAVGGFAFGLGLAYVVVQAMWKIDDPVVETILSLALAVGVYAGAQALGLSGPMAAVAAGFLVGGAADKGGETPIARVQLRSFWSLVDELLNALLFLALGFEVLVLPFDSRFAGLALATIPLVLLVRLAIVAPWGAYFRERKAIPGAVSLLAWGGLRGGLSLALALGAPEGPHHAPLISLTYAVVVFSVLVQGLTFGALAERFRSGSETAT